MAILDLLSDREATTSQLADALGRPKGTIGYHLKTLERAGLVQLVRTEKVRAIDAKYYGRTAKTFLLGSNTHVDVDPNFMLQEAISDLTAARQHGGDLEGRPSILTLRHMQLPEDRAAEWSQRLTDLAAEFVDQSPGGSIRYGFLVGLFPTARPTLNEPTDV